MRNSESAQLFTYNYFWKLGLRLPTSQFEFSTSTTMPRTLIMIPTQFISPAAQLPVLSCCEVSLAQTQTAAFNWIRKKSRMSAVNIVDKH